LGRDPEERGFRHIFGTFVSIDGHVFSRVGQIPALAQVNCLHKETITASEAVVGNGWAQWGWAARAVVWAAHVLIPGLPWQPPP
jgi:hypothetical protein